MRCWPASPRHSLLTLFGNESAPRLLKRPSRCHLPPRVTPRGICPAYSRTATCPRHHRRPGRESALLLRAFGRQIRGPGFQNPPGLSGTQQGPCSVQPARHIRTEVSRGGSPAIFPSAPMSSRCSPKGCRRAGWIYMAVQTLVYRPISTGWRRGRCCSPTTAITPPPPFAAFVAS